jgi:hypothetical protein
MAEPGGQRVRAIDLVAVVVHGLVRTQREDPRRRRLRFGPVVVALRFFGGSHIGINGGELRDDIQESGVIAVGKDSQPGVTHDLARRLVAIPFGHDLHDLVAMITAERDDLNEVRIHRIIMHRIKIARSAVDTCVGAPREGRLGTAQPFDFGTASRGGTLGRLFSVRGDLSQLGNFVMQATGGPARYHGRDMSAAHAHLGVTPAHFSRVARHLADELAALGLDDQMAGEVVALVATLEPQIVAEG